MSLYIVPLTTYFIIGDKPFPATIQKHIETTDGEVCTNLYYLGKQGVLTTSEGLKIAFVSGDQTHDESAPTAVSYSKVDIRKLCLTKFPVSSPPGVDFLLSHEWPENISQLSSLPVTADQSKNSVYISELAAALKPRYHFASYENTFYEREPYKNIVSGFGAQEERPAAHATRFIGLGHVLNKEKQRVSTHSMDCMVIIINFYLDIVVLCIQFGAHVQGIYRSFGSVTRKYNRMSVCHTVLG